MDRRMDRWMVQAVDMCFYARKEVRKYVLSEDAFLEIEKVVRGPPKFLGVLVCVQPAVFRHSPTENVWELTEKI